MKTRITTEVLQSYYHTPLSGVAAAFPVVLRAGHLRASADYVVERRRSQGHDLLLCVAGRGEVRMRNHRFPVGKCELAWIDGHEPHGHRAHPADPWELCWLRVDGPGLGALRSLLGAVENPVFRFSDNGAEVRGCFRQILRLMGGTALHREERIYVWLARLVAILRRTTAGARVRRAAVPPEIETVLNRIALYPHRRWTVNELAGLARMNATCFHRRFRQVTGSSPIDWLRRERINLAKRCLTESADPIKTVADHAGYNSPYFFSRDFKRHTGVSPSEFRRQEQRER